MKIAIIGKKIGLAPDSAGGAQTLARNIAKLCVTRGIHVDFILWDATSQRVENYQVGERNLDIYYFPNAKKALWLIASRGCTKIVVFMIPLSEILLLYKIGRSKKLFYFDLYFSKIYKRIIKKIFVKLLFYKVVTFSPRIARSYFLLKNKVIYSLPLVSDKILENVKREIHYEQYPRFAYVGGIFVEKGIKRLIRVFNRINIVSNKKIPLAIFGYYNPSNVKDKEILHEINTLPFITEKILDFELSCSKNHESSLAQFYNKTDVIILPYTRKHINSIVDIPLVIMEALLSGCIVITPKIKHYEEIGVSKEYQYENEEELEKIILSINYQKIKRENKTLREKRVKYLNIVDQFFTNIVNK